MKFFEKVKTNLRNGKLRQIRILGFPILQYYRENSKETNYRIPFLCKKLINKTKPVFYLKINRQDAYSFLCLQHWIDTIESIGADYFILCDKEKLERDVLKRIIFPNTNIKFLKSCRNKKLKMIVDKIATKFWIKATYAHLTTFYHAQKNNISSFWNIDADDTLFCMEPQILANYLKKIEQYAETKDFGSFSLDMHRSRTLGRHWSFGITYTRMNTDWFSILNNNPDSSWQKHYEKYDYEFNLDWFFTYLKDFKNIKNETFYIDNSYFIHWGNFLTNVIGSGVFNWKNNRLYFPIILSVLNDKYFGNIQIADDCHKFDSKLSDEDAQNFIVNYVTYLYKPSKQMTNLWVNNSECERSIKS